MEPFPTSVSKVLTWIFATSTKICTRGRSTRAHALGFVTGPPRTPTRLLVFNKADGEVWAARLSAIHFQGKSLRSVSCYTLLSGFRLPWPPSDCLERFTPFVVSDERAFRRLNLAFGSSHIASSAYQKWPTRNSHSYARRSIKQQGLPTHLKFENRARTFRPRVR
jgi:hypothetical protein